MLVCHACVSEGCMLLSLLWSGEVKEDDGVGGGKECEEEVMSLEDIVAGDLFGVDLEVVYRGIVSRSGFEVFKKKPYPVVLYNTFSFLNEYGLSTVGIFRKSPNLDEISEVKNQICNEGEIRFVDCEQDVHKASNIVKCFLRELPEPILTTKLSWILMRLARSLTLDSMNVILKTVQQLPPENLIIINALIKLMINISEHESENKMSVHSLSTIFAPLFVRSASNNLTKIMEEYIWIRDIIENIMRHYKYIKIFARRALDDLKPGFIPEYVPCDPFPVTAIQSVKNKQSPFINFSVFKTILVHATDPTGRWWYGSLDRKEGWFASIKAIKDEIIEDFYSDHPEENPHSHQFSKSSRDSTGLKSSKKKEAFKKRSSSSFLKGKRIKKTKAKPEKVKREKVDGKMKETPGMNQPKYRFPGVKDVRDSDSPQKDRH
eukprot:TRINITY_DN1352_c0_g1_i5.p1 TRINITY_DN1352_c0_g1~~TRINITY_DN1352_c0_g1_i5.p1  ORF type:complete len:433 (-),score=102.72 TRINITY_DN1352_c0_g1_i5:45-1343(-)